MGAGMIILIILVIVAAACLIIAAVTDNNYIAPWDDDDADAYFEFRRREQAKEDSEQAKYLSEWVREKKEEQDARELCKRLRSENRNRHYKKRG